MKTWVRRSLHAGALTAGALLVTGSAAQAAPDLTSANNLGALTGTQALVPVQLPVNVCGNAVAAAGNAVAGCEGGATAVHPAWLADLTMTSTGNTGIGNGTQLVAPIQAPVNVCGNAVAVAGNAAAACEGGAEAGPPEEKPEKPEYPKGGHGYPRQYERGSSTPDDPAPRADAPAAEVVSITEATTLTSTGNVGLLNGTQLLAPIQVPVNICGNAIGVLGNAQAACQGGASAS